MDERTRALQNAQAAEAGTHSCGCVGPRDGQPLCPCRMRGVIERDGRYIMPEQDLGPVSRVEGARFRRLLADMDGLTAIGKALLSRPR